MVGRANSGVDPTIMGTGPIPATERVMERTGLSPADMDVIELNEAFSSVALVCSRELGLDAERTNPNGGAVALGLPRPLVGTAPAGPGRGGRGTAGGGPGPAGRLISFTCLPPFL